MFNIDRDYIKTNIVYHRSGGESLQLDAGNLQRRNYWLERLRKERRSFGGRCLYLVQHPELRACFTPRGNLVGVLYSLHVERSFRN
jgi:hypothetical protein